MDALAEFAALVAAPDAPPLDRAVALIAAHVRPPVAVDHLLGTLDDLAAVSQVHTFDDLCRFMGSDLGFVGNAHDYGDPENSMLDAVLAWRAGIPITLCVVFGAFARRAGVGVEMIGMPGHFLVRSVDSGRFCDPFAGCVTFDTDGCRRLHDAVYGERRVFDPERDLAPTPPIAVLTRVLANLEQGRLATNRSALRRVLELHASLPVLAPADALLLAGRLAGVGDHATAARVADRAVTQLDGDARDAAERAAISYWSVTN